MHLSEETIRFSEFYVSHRAFLKRLFIFTLFFIDLVIIAGLSLRFFAYNKGTIDHLKMVQNLSRNYIPFADIKPLLKTSPLVIREVSVVPSLNRTYDLVGEIYNPNPKWNAKEVSYYFSVDGVRTETKKTFILPGHTQYVMSFNEPDVSFGSKVSLVLENTSWKRVRDTSQVSIVDNLVVTEPRFNNDPIQGFQIDSKLRNNTPLGFWAVGISTIVYSGSDIVGINFTTLEQVGSNTSRDLSVSWPQVLTSPTSVKLIPVLNILDDDNIMPAAGLDGTGDPSGLELE